MYVVHVHRQKEEAMVSRPLRNNVVPESNFSVGLNSKCGRIVEEWSLWVRCGVSMVFHSIRFVTVKTPRRLRSTEFDLCKLSKKSKP